MTQPMKMSVIDKLKSVFKPKPAPYKSYAPAQLRVLAMRARIYLQQHFKKCLQLIQAEDSVLLQCKQSPGDCYRILQEIGKHVVQVESMKIYVEILRKIQDRSAGIIKTNGDIALLRTEINWFQCLLWYRKCRKITGLEELNTFCYNFFKGVDVTCEITPKCQIFKICPLFLYLDPKCIIPIKKLYPDIALYISTKLDLEFLNQLFKVNKNDIKRWMNQERIQYQEKFISKSKSPVRIEKKTPPKKIENNANNTMNLSKKVSIDSIDLNPHPELKKQELSSSSQQKSSTFMRKLMQTSKLKPKQICAECGKQLQTPTSSQNQKEKQQLASFSKICPTCQNQKNKKIEQQQNKIKEEQDSFICRVCQKKISNSGDLSFNGVSGNNSFSFSEPICHYCMENQMRNEQKNQINDSACHLFEDSQEPSKKDQILPNIIQNNEKIPLQIQEPYHQIPKPAADIKKDDKIYEQEFDDQEESLRFIRQHIMQKKKPVKKPYMVSIYARAQYINQSFKK